MAKKDINFSHLDMAWGFYLQSQSPKEVHRRCLDAGLSVHINTVSRWINKGIPNHEVESFKDRHARIQGAAQAIAAQRASNEAAEIRVTSETVDQITTAQAEVIATATTDALAVKIGAANLEQWRGQMDLQLLHAAVANDKMLETLMGMDPADPKAVKDVMTAWKNCVSAQRGIIESHSVLRTMNDPDAGIAAKGSDREIMEHFKGWTVEEHRAFRERGIWPTETQGPAPDYILSIMDGDAEDDDPEDVE
jgi:hypothetical protein